MLWRLTERQKWLLYFQEMKNWVIICLYFIREYELTKHLPSPLCLLLNQRRFDGSLLRVFMNAVCEGDFALWGPPGEKVLTHAVNHHHGAQCFWLQCAHRPLCTWELITCENSNLKTKSSLSHMRVEKQGNTPVFFFLNNLFPFFPLFLLNFFYPFFESSCFWTANSQCCFSAWIEFLQQVINPWK